MRFRPISLIAVTLAIPLGTVAQTLPEFEVASVKPAAPGSGPIPMLPRRITQQLGFEGGPGSKNPGRIDYHAVTLRMLLGRAYDLRPDQISGPGWLDSERYDIVAKLPPDTNAEQFRSMLQRLLTDRFRIRSHRETKTAPVYRLTVARNGPKLAPPEVAPVYKDAAERMAAFKAQALARIDARLARMKDGDRGPSNDFHLPRSTLAELAEALSSHLDHPVKDMTQLEGVYSFTLTWTPDTSPPASEAPLGPSIFAAVQEQLGLKLEAGKEEMEWLVLDSVEKTPAEN